MAGAQHLCVLWLPDPGRVVDSETSMPVVRLGGRADEASYSLEDARRNFRRHWTMYDVEHPESWVAPPTAEEIALKRELIELYEALRAEPDEWTSLTDRLRKAERELDRLVLRRAGA
jgi:hypothetical protein